MSRFSIANILKSKRKDAGLSVEAVRDKLNAYGIELSNNSLYNYESGYRQPDVDTLMALCEIYEINDVLCTFGYKSYNSKDQYSAKFRDELLGVLESADPEDTKSMYNVQELNHIVETSCPLFLFEACEAAEVAGISIDSLIWRNIEDQQHLPIDNKKSPSAAEAAPGDEIENQNMDLVQRMLPEQKALLLALLRTVLEQTQGKLAFAHQSAGAAVLQSGLPDKP